MNTRLAALLTLTLVAPATTACGEEGQRFPAVTHAATAKECAACHIAFPPQMLPARSWDKLMGDLANHFGEDASLPEAQRAEITRYLVENAGDAKGSWAAHRTTRGIAADSTPLRITETPYWVRAHDEIRASRFADPKVKSKANCIACHKTADKGEFFEDEEEED